MISYLMVVMTTVSLGLAFIPAAWASSTSDTCVSLANARAALYSMLSVKDKTALDELNTKVQATSTRVDSLLAGMTGADAKVAADFKTVWDQFKATREEQIIPGCCPRPNSYGMDHCGELDLAFLDEENRVPDVTL